MVLCQLELGLAATKFAEPWREDTIAVGHPHGTETAEQLSLGVVRFRHD